jgi:hypothetical protein
MAGATGRSNRSQSKAMIFSTGVRMIENFLFLRLEIFFSFSHMFH